MALTTDQRKSDRQVILPDSSLRGYVRFHALPDQIVYGQDVPISYTVDERFWPKLTDWIGLFRAEDHTPNTFSFVSFRWAPVKPNPQFSLQSPAARTVVFSFEQDFLRYQPVTSSTCYKFFYMHAADSVVSQSDCIRVISQSAAAAATATAAVAATAATAAAVAATAAATATAAAAAAAAAAADSTSAQYVTPCSSIAAASAAAISDATTSAAAEYDILAIPAQPPGQLLMSTNIASSNVVLTYEERVINDKEAFILCAKTSSRPNVGLKLNKDGNRSNTSSRVKVVGPRGIENAGGGGAGMLENRDMSENDLRPGDKLTGQIGGIDKDKFDYIDDENEEEIYLDCLTEPLNSQTIPNILSKISPNLEPGDVTNPSQELHNSRPDDNKSTSVVDSNNPDSRVDASDIQTEIKSGVGLHPISLPKDETLAGNPGKEVLDNVIGDKDLMDPVMVSLLMLGKLNIVRNSDQTLSITTSNQLDSSPINLQNSLVSINHSQVPPTSSNCSQDPPISDSIPSRAATEPQGTFVNQPETTPATVVSLQTTPKVIANSIIFPNRSMDSQTPPLSQVTAGTVQATSATSESSTKRFDYSKARPITDYYAKKYRQSTEYSCATPTSRCLSQTPPTGACYSKCTSATVSYSQAPATGSGHPTTVPTAVCHTQTTPRSDLISQATSTTETYPNLALLPVASKDTQTSLTFFQESQTPSLDVGPVQLSEVLPLQPLAFLQQLSQQKQQSEWKQMSQQKQLSQQKLLTQMKQLPQQKQLPQNQLSQQNMLSQQKQLSQPQQLPHQNQLSEMEYEECDRQNDSNGSRQLDILLESGSRILRECESTGQAVELLRSLVESETQRATEESQRDTADLHTSKNVKCHHNVTLRSLRFDLNSVINTQRKLTEELQIVRRLMQRLINRQVVSQADGYRINSLSSVNSKSVQTQDAAAETDYVETTDDVILKEMTSMEVPLNRRHKKNSAGECCDDCYCKVRYILPSSNDPPLHSQLPITDGSRGLGNMTSAGGSPPDRDMDVVGSHSTLEPEPIDGEFKTGLDESYGTHDDVIEDKLMLRQLCEVFTNEDEIRETLEQLHEELTECHRQPMATRNQKEDQNQKILEDEICFRSEAGGGLLLSPPGKVSMKVDQTILTVEQSDKKFPGNETLNTFLTTGKDEIYEEICAEDWRKIDHHEIRTEREASAKRRRDGSSCSPRRDNDRKLLKLYREQCKMDDQLKVERDRSRDSDPGRMMNPDEEILRKEEREKAWRMRRLDVEKGRPGKRSRSMSVQKSKKQKVPSPNEVKGYVEPLLNISNKSKATADTTSRQNSAKPNIKDIFEIIGLACETSAGQFRNRDGEVSAAENEIRNGKRSRGRQTKNVKKKSVDEATRDCSKASKTKHRGKLSVGSALRETEKLVAMLLEQFMTPSIQKDNTKSKTPAQHGKQNARSLNTKKKGRPDKLSRICSYRACLDEPNKSLPGCADTDEISPKVRNGAVTEPQSSDGISRSTKKSVKSKKIREISEERRQENEPLAQQNQPTMISGADNELPRNSPNSGGRNGKAMAATARKNVELDVKPYLIWKKGRRTTWNIVDDKQNNLPGGGRDTIRTVDGDARPKYGSLLDLDKRRKLRDRQSTKTSLSKLTREIETEVKNQALRDSEEIRINCLKEMIRSSAVEDKMAAEKRKDNTRGKDSASKASIEHATISEAQWNDRYVGNASCEPERAAHGKTDRDTGFSSGYGRLSLMSISSDDHTKSSLAQYPTQREQIEQYLDSMNIEDMEDNNRDIDYSEFIETQSQNTRGDITNELDTFSRPSGRSDNYATRHSESGNTVENIFASADDTKSIYSVGRPDVNGLVNQSGTSVRTQSLANPDLESTNAGKNSLDVEMSKRSSHLSSSCFTIPSLGNLFDESFLSGPVTHRGSRSDKKQQNNSYAELLNQQPRGHFYRLRRERSKETKRSSRSRQRDHLIVENLSETPTADRLESSGSESRERSVTRNKKQGKNKDKLGQKENRQDLEVVKDTSGQDHKVKLDVVKGTSGQDHKVKLDVVKYTSTGQEHKVKAERRKEKRRKGAQGDLSRNASKSPKRQQDPESITSIEKSVTPPEKSDIPIGESVILLQESVTPNKESVTPTEESVTPPESLTPLDSIYPSLQ